jgi:glycerol-3-phosphate dehydrogenase (NAD(P)+)
VNIAILGAGAWGTALAAVLSARHGVRLWVRDPDQCAQIRARRENRRYLPGVALPDALTVSDGLPHVLEACELAILGVTVSGLRPTLRRLTELGQRVPVIWLCKGFETGSARLPHEVAGEELPPDVLRGVLSGPSFADEVARGSPAAVTLAASDLEFASGVARELHGPRLRVYSSDDIVGVEVGGAVKNVIAIAAGISDGLRFGASARAALITRGLAEMSRLAEALGGRRETLSGLAGLGDLVLTCTGALSRNRGLGFALGRGARLEEHMASTPMVIEGVRTAVSALQLASRAGVETPIIAQVHAVLHENKPPAAAIQALLARDLKREEG